MLGFGYALDVLEALTAGPLSFERLFLDVASLVVELLDSFSEGCFPFRA
jgi:hypothetical protein